MSDAGRVWTFIVLEHLVMAAKAMVDMLIDDVPEHVRIQTKRQDFLVRKVIGLEPDDDESALKRYIRRAKGNQGAELMIFDSHQIGGRKKKKLDQLI